MMSTQTATKAPGLLRCSAASSRSLGIMGVLTGRPMPVQPPDTDGTIRDSAWRKVRQRTRSASSGTNTNGTASHLTSCRVWVNCIFVHMWTAPIIAITEETQREFEYPQREAAFFY